NAVGRIAIFDTRNNEDFVGTDFGTCFAKFSQPLRRKPTVMLGHHEHTASAIAEFSAQIGEGPLRVVGPLGVHVTDGGDFHRKPGSLTSQTTLVRDDKLKSMLRLEDVALDGIERIGEENLAVIASPVVPGIFEVKMQQIKNGFAHGRPS